MRFHPRTLFEALFPSKMLERAVRSGDEAGVILALSRGADANHRLMRTEPLYATAAFGAWTIVDEGSVLQLAMEGGHDRIGLHLANAGAIVPSHYQDRIVQQRWRARVEQGA